MRSGARTRMILAAVAGMILMGVDAEAGLFSLFKRQSVGRLNTTDLAQKMTSEIKAAIQVGEISGYVETWGGQDGWTGKKWVLVRASYGATFGISIGMLDQGFRIEKRPFGRNPTNLVIVLQPPVLLGEAGIDTTSIKLVRVEKGGLGGFWSTDKYKGDAVRRMSPEANADARIQVNSSENREMTKRVVKDLLLDVIGATTSGEMKRYMAGKVSVVFDDELVTVHEMEAGGANEPVPLM